ncbi:Os09g0573150, partial [Oryza sativa Japonica Group]
CSNGGGGDGSLKRGFPNHPLLTSSGSPLASATSTAAPALLVVGTYFVPFLLPILPRSSSSDDHLVIGELCVVSPCVQVDLDALKGTHLGMYEQRNVTVLVEAGESASEVVAAEAYFVHTSYAKA